MWFNTSHMHFRTHVKPESRGQSGRWQSEYHDVMIDHDKCIGEMLDFLDKLGIADNTFVMYSTDNGPHMNTWPDAGMTPFRNEKNSSWEGAYRVPAHGALPRARSQPGRSRTRSSATRTGSRPSWPWPASPTSRRSSRRATRSARRPSRCISTATTCCRYLTGKEEKSPRKGFIYFTDDGDVAALRYDNWKMVFMEQRVAGTLKIWAEPFVHAARARRSSTCAPIRTSARRLTSNTFYDWMFRHIYLLVPAQAIVAEFLATFKEFPPRQKAASFSLDQVIEKMTAAFRPAADDAASWTTRCTKAGGHSPWRTPLRL